jgi:membrane protein required for colicin V production
MSLFDLAAGLLLMVSATVGWIRGASREVATIVALVIAAIVSLGALRFSGPVARHAITMPWLANIVAILLVFAAVYILLRVVAAAMTRRLHQTSLGNADRAVGGFFGIARALVVLGLANLTLNALIPAERMPGWISDALLYPLSSVSASGLKAFAPHGVDLAKKVAPAVGHAIVGGGRTDQNRDNNAAAAKPVGTEDPP